MVRACCRSLTRGRGLKLTLTLPHDMAAMVKAKVASGEYVTESEVIRDGLRAPLARDAAVESWLRDEVAKSNDAYEADPKSGSPADEVMARVWASYRGRVAKSDRG